MGHSQIAQACGEDQCEPPIYSQHTIKFLRTTQQLSIRRFWELQGIFLIGSNVYVPARWLHALRRRRIIVLNPLGFPGGFAVPTIGYTKWDLSNYRKKEERIVVTTCSICTLPYQHLALILRWARKIADSRIGLLTPNYSETERNFDPSGESSRGHSRVVVIHRWPHEML